MTIGQTIKTARILRGITSAKVADSVGVNRVTFSAFENDRKIPSLEVAAQIEEALNTAPGHIMAAVIQERLDKINKAMGLSLTVYIE